MLHITGGCYHEVVLEPSGRALYGSGGRAAAALQRLEGDVRLTTYIGEAEELTLTALGHSFGFEVESCTVPRTVMFTYEHGLAVPDIFPPLHLIEAGDSIIIEAEAILRFGFIEGDAIVHGKRVVYDPQSAYSPQPFARNGSSAETLAIVCNRREATLLAGESDLFTAAKKLLQNSESEVVVVKCGSQGALVVNADESTSHIPAYRTDRVWTIGSGDVFASVFAHYWASQNVDPVEAATRASLATAYYCNGPILPISNELDSETFQPLDLPLTREIDAFPKVYLAGPFFNSSQRWLIRSTRDALREQSVEVFSPYHDVGYGSAADVVPADIEAVRTCSALFAVLDGLDPGTIFEVGYARALEKPVIGYSESQSREDLKMMEGTDCEIYSDFVTAIHKTVWAASDNR